jgi:hypothetical protein
MLKRCVLPLHKPDHVTWQDSLKKSHTDGETERRAKEGRDTLNQAKKCCLDLLVGLICWPMQAMLTHPFSVHYVEFNKRLDGGLSGSNDSAKAYMF